MICSHSETMFIRSTSYVDKENSCMTFCWCFVELPTFASMAEGRCIPIPAPACTDLSLVSTVLNILIACQVKKSVLFADNTPRQCTATEPQRLFPVNVFFSSSKISTFFLSSHPALGSYRISDNRKLSFSACIHSKERR